MSNWLEFLTVYLKEVSTIIVSAGIVLAFIKNVSSKIKPYKDIGEKISNIEKKMEYVHKELSYNSGTSIKDKICKIQETSNKNIQLVNSVLCKQRWLLDNKPEPIFETDDKGLFTWVNESFIRLVKRGKDDLLGSKWKIIISEEERDSCYKHWEEAIEEKRNFEQTIFITDKKGQKYSCKCVASLQEDGKYIGTFSDITVIYSE
jgi:PAS domain S-box-containing protein